VYNNYFGFKERPFKLVPDPAYLFLSKSHEEALAHMVYAVVQGDGFVEITGEIGIGKTTLCRAFLENLDENTKFAYIFNPKLNAIQLLKAINDEFGIASDADNSKDLIDTLNAFLIEEKSKGMNVILLVDEAQNLSREVLEQLRLLSNLETSRHKLLQIMLVGQPELGEKLDSPELRQLDQRITLSCRLIPFDYRELTEYIQHRINIASGKAGVQFTRSAYQAVYRYSKGIPRLINIVCDRSLLTAYILEQKKITGKIVKTSIKELTGRINIKRYVHQQKKKVLLLSSILIPILLIVFIYPSGFLNLAGKLNKPENKKLEKPQTKRFKIPAFTALDHHVGSVNLKEANDSDSDQKINLEPLQTMRSNPIQVTSSELTAVKESKSGIEFQDVKNKAPVVEPADRLRHFLEAIDHLYSRNYALKIAMNLWNGESEIKRHYNSMSDDRTFFHLAAKENGLLIRQIKGNLTAIKRLNLPAIFAFSLPGNPYRVYLTLVKINEYEFTLKGGEKNKRLEVTQKDLESFWSGDAYIPWKNFLSIKGTIPLDSPEASVTTLKVIMKDIGFNEVEINPFYDDITKQAVKEIQRKYGLHVDGVVGSTTKIALHNEKNFLEFPHITHGVN